jgi:hypothetical protein
MAHPDDVASTRDRWIAAVALLALTGFAVWIPLAGGQRVEPIFLLVWWGLAAVSLASAGGLALGKTWARRLLGISTGIWLVLSGLTLIGVGMALGQPRTFSVAATIGWGAAAVFVAAAIALWFGLRATRAR